MQRYVARWLIALLTTVGLLTACDKSSTYRHEEQRVVSLAPALTQMIVDFGASDSLVAVAENDSAAPAGIPTVGNYLNLDAEGIASADPTHVLMMVGQEGVPATLHNLARRRRFKLIAYPYPNTLFELNRILYNYEDVTLKAEPGVPESVAGVLQRYAAGRKHRLILGKLAEIDKLVDDKDRPRVLLVITTNPVTASGLNTVHSDVLTYLLGAKNAADISKGAAPVLDKELLIKSEPDVILLLLPNAPALWAIGSDPRLAVFKNLAVPAVRNRRIVLINDPLVLLPSTSLIRVGRTMAKAIHPELASKIDEVLDSPSTPDSDPGVEDQPSGSDTGP